jgi:hypothetical protein
VGLCAVFNAPQQQYLITIYITMIVGTLLDGNHTSLARKNKSQKRMFQMFDAGGG